MAWFQYGVIEKALAEVFCVTPGQMGALRGRLRHLRNINCPKLPKTGSGQPVWITREQAIEILIAIELGRLGVAPRHAVEAGKFYAEEISDPNQDTLDHGGHMIVSPSLEFAGREPGLSALHLPNVDPGTLLYADADAVTSLQKATPSLISRLLAGGTFAVVNLARSVALLDAALHRASAGTRFQLQDDEVVSTAQQQRRNGRQQQKQLAAVTEPAAASKPPAQRATQPRRRRPPGSRDKQE
jgi:hypothetical protein